MTTAARQSSAVRVAKALGDPTRFRLLREISLGEERSCRDLTAKLRIAQATVSHHLRVLSEAGLVTAREEGHYHWYRVRREAIAEHARAVSEAFGRPRRGKGRAR